VLICIMARITLFLFALILAVSMTVAASAQVFVHGNGLAQACYMSAKTGNPGHKSAIRECENALQNVSLTRKDEAATHINLGVLLMRRGDNSEAQSHYQKAIELRPKTPEAYINHGASLIYTGDYHEAISAINTAIDLGTEKLPEALFNRAMAYDGVQDYTRAYKDLKQALTLKPDWPVALKALDNYQVTTRAQTN